MASSSSPSGAGYWYSGDSSSADSVDVLNALRAYREAEKDMRRRMGDSMKMNQTDLLAVRYVLRARQSNQSIGPKDLSRMLGISTPSTTALIDRLEKSGHVMRQSHPTDRRALELVPTDSADSDVRQSMHEMHQRMLAVARSLSESEARTVTVFLQQMASAFQFDDSRTGKTTPED